jgi:small GTP-binding protein
VDKQTGGQENNRAMLLTPPGSAAVAVVRLAGRRVEDFLQNYFSRRALIGRCVHGELRDGERVIDDPVVVRVSDTIADLNVHGGAWVVQATIELARRAGFTYVASDPAMYDADSMLEREILEAIPLARTELALRTLAAQPQAWEEFRRSSPSPEVLRGVLADRWLLHLLYPPRVAIVGAPNVGKSTLANRLFAQERSITADVPGTTRDWVGEIANIDGLPVMLVDTPGQRDTTDAIERAAIAQSREQVHLADLIIMVLDAARPLAPEQAPLFDLYRDRDALRVINRCDMPAAWKWSLAPGAIHTIATRGAGIDELRAAIIARFRAGADANLSQPRIWTARQREIVERAMHGPRALSDL